MAHTGIVGFFDILGYQSFLANNAPDAAEKVVSKLIGIEDSMGTEMRKAFSHHQTPEKVEELIGLIHWLVFSDTIVLYSHFDDQDKPSTRSNRWLVFNFVCILLWRKMFEYGLPLRGVIHTGDFLVQRACFAGRAIVEAYQLAEDFDLAACAYSPKAFTELIEHANATNHEVMWSYIPTQIFEYLVPRKMSPSVRMHVINPLTIILQDQNRYMKGDISQLVHEVFLKHNKDIAAQAIPKLENTERYLRAAKGIFGDAIAASDRMLSLREKNPER